MQMDADSVLDYLEEAELAGLIASTLEYPEARFRFSHELIRQTAIGRLSLARRQRLHLDIANAIERVYAQSLEGRVNDLAHHLFHAGTAAESTRTARYIAMAAHRAVEQGAFSEAEEFYRRAIDAIEMNGETPERNRQELELRIELGNTYIATRGYTAAETAATFDRAAALVERLGEPVQVVLAMSGQFAQPLLQGKMETARAFANRIWAIAERCHSKDAQSLARHFQGCSNYQLGALDEARNYLTEAIALYVEEDALARPTDQGLEALSFLALTEWQRGMIDTARSRIKQASVLAERLHKPYALAYQRYFEAHLSALLRDAPACQTLAEAGLEQITGQPLPLFFDIFRILRGWALAQQGRWEEGVSFTRAGLTGFKAGGYGLSIGLYHGFLAETLCLSNSLAEASATVEEGISTVGDQLIDLPYLLWLRGELSVRTAHESVMVRDSSDRGLTLESAEANFRKSISVANRIGAKTMALRAATSLARLLNIQSRSSEALDVVAPILKEFTEGFDTRDLVEASKICELEDARRKKPKTG
jgi:adenylate cyclase